MKKRAVQIRRMGKELGLPLPADWAEALNLSEGDEVQVVHNGEVLLAYPSSEAETSALEAAREFMQRYPNAMKKLAGTD